MFVYGLMGCLVLVAAVIGLRSYLMNRSQSPVRRTSRKRGLFRFRDGVNIREVDPIEVLARFEEHPEFRHDLHPKRCERGEVEALELLASTVRGAFGIAPYSQPGRPGLTIRECYELYCVFAHYIGSQKKSTNRSLTSPPDSVATSSDCTGMTTNDTLACG